MEEYAAAVDAAAANVEAASAGLKAAQDATAASSDSMAKGIRRNYAGIDEQAIPDLDKLSEAFQKAESEGKKFEGALSEGGKEVSKFGQFLSSVHNHLGNLATKLAENVPLLQKFHARMGGISGTIGQTFQNSISSVSDRFSKLGSVVGGAVHDAFARLQTLVDSISNSTLGKIITGAIGGVRTAFSALGSAVTAVHNRFSQFGTTAKNLATTSVSRLKSAMTSLMQTGFGKAMTSAINAVHSGFTKLTNGAKTTVNAIGSVTKATVGIIGWFGKLTGQTASVTGRVARLSSAFLTLGLTAKGVPTWVHMVALGLAGLSGAASGVLALGIPAMFMGMAFGAFQYKQAMDKAIASGQQLTATQQIMYPIVSTITDSFKSLGPVVQNVGKEFDKAMQSIGPALTSIAQNLAPMITALGKGLSDFVVILANGLAPVMKAVQPVMQAFATGLGTIAHGLVGLLSNINFGQAATGLNDLFNAIGKLLPLVGQILNAFIPLAHVVLGPLLDAFIKLVQTIAGALGPVLTNLAPVLGKIVASLSPIIAALGRFLNAVLPLLVPLGQLVETFISGLVPVVSALIQPLSDVFSACLPLVNIFFQLLGAIAPLIPPIVQVIAAIGGPLTKALLSLMPLVLQLINLISAQLIKVIQLWAPPIVQLIPPLTQLIGALLQLVVQALAPLLPILPELAKSFIQIFVALIPIIPALLQLVQAVTPMIVVVAQLVALLVGDLLPIATKIAVFLTNILVAAFKVAAKAVQDAINAIMGILGHLLQAGEDIITFWKDVFTGKWRAAFDVVLNMLRNVVDAIGGVFSGIYHVGEDIVKGIWHGIQNMAGWLYNQAKNFAGSILNGIKNVLGISSPSRLFAEEVGQNIPAGIAQGILSHAHLVGTAAQQVADQAVKSAQFGLGNMSASLNLAASNALGAGGPQSIQVVFQGNQLMSDRDMQIFVDKMGPQLVNILQRGGMNIRK